ncbi:hypothetical protein [Kribbella deserti]|uniref:Major facilitator superfamily (MFS) profile domain-containing protein n=1 Tax=Kribbella deserti TaxID=1926257 RepID=A0ABV6QLQ4_9ACTN
MQPAPTLGERVGLACALMAVGLTAAVLAAGAIALIGSLAAFVIGVYLGSVVGGCCLYTIAVRTRLGVTFGLLNCGALIAAGMFGVFPSLDHSGGLALLIGGLFLFAAATALLTAPRTARPAP